MTPACLPAEQLCSMLQRAGGSLAGVDVGGGLHTSAWHMWLAEGAGPEDLGGRMTGGCDCA